MANRDICLVCGCEVFTGVDAGNALLIGYCECVKVPEVPEVDVYELEQYDDSEVLKVEDDEFVYVYTEADLLAECGRDQDDHYQNINPIYAFFKIWWDVATYRNNNPKLVFGWYLFCGYLIVAYSLAILYILCRQ